MTLSAVRELEKLVSFNTVNDGKDKKASSECPRYIGSKLEEFGFISELIESNGFYTSFARRGQGKFKILFLAHHDVVPVGDAWDSDPFKLKVDGDRAYGRGTCDDKGNIVSMLLLAEKLAESDLPCNVMMATAGDEEIGGVNGALVLRNYLIKQGLFPDYIVIADGIHQQVIYRRRNTVPTYIKVKKMTSETLGKKETMRFTTEVFGSETRHSAYLRPGVDRHAMLTASKYLDLHPDTVVSDIRGAFLKSNVIPDWVEMDLVHPDESGAKIQYDVTLTDLLRSLLTISQVPFPTMPSDKGTIINPNLLSLDQDLWTLYCDIRAMTNDGTAVQQALETALAGKVELFSLQSKAGPGYIDSNPDSLLIRTVVWALQKEGIPPRLVEGSGASDSRYFAGQGADLFDFGPEGDNLHGPNEWVSLSSIEQNAAFFHTLLDVLSRDKSPV